MNIPLSRILPNPSQPRQYFDPAMLEERAASIRIHGVIQPITVEEAPDGRFILHDGECRVRAARQAGLEVIPAEIVPPLNGSGPLDRLLRALVANVQRSDLAPSEEGRAYAILRDEHRLSVDEIARQMGLNRVRIDHALLIHDLPGPVQDLIDRHRLPKDMRLVRAFLELPEGARLPLAEKLARRGVTIAEGIAACHKALQALAAAPQDTKPPCHPPAVELAAKHAGVEPPPRKWDIFAQAGGVPSWAMLEAAAREVCTRCDLASYASPTTCQLCPAAEMIGALIGKVEGK